jgi:single-strand DNA-binding protein
MGKDPELKYTKKDKPVLTCRIATSEGYGDRKETEWHNVVVFGKTAENAAQYLKKGSMVYIEGRIRGSSWENEKGQKIYKKDIIANKVIYLSTEGGCGRSFSDNRRELPAQPDTSIKYDEDDDYSKSPF